ncbi:MAG: hypothetical protein GC162_08770 [Planctomycetes bacterium]|nr:hypothetical protein [Planctomycetota bacterium]
MGRDVQTLLKLRVPVIVRLGHRDLSLSRVLALIPGAIIELPQLADEPLDLMVNNKVVGNGVAVKIGENFGLKVTYIGDPAQRVAALGGGQPKPDEKPAETPEPAAAT